MKCNNSLENSLSATAGHTSGPGIADHIQTKAQDGPIPHPPFHRWPCLLARKGSCGPVLSLSREKRFSIRLLLLLLLFGYNLLNYFNLLWPPIVARHMLHLSPRQFSSQKLAFNGSIQYRRSFYFSVDFNYIVFLLIFLVVMCFGGMFLLTWCIGNSSLF